MQIAKSEYKSKDFSYTVKLTDRQQLYLLIETVQSYIIDCQREYNELDKNDEQYESDCRYFEKKMTDLLFVRKTLFDAANREGVSYE